MSAAFATGNAQILVPSQKTSLLATELYQVLDTSDVPGGYINILTAKDNELNQPYRSMRILMVFGILVIRKVLKRIL